MIGAFSNLMRKLQKLKLILFGDVRHLQPEVAYKTEWCGDLYGGFYVIPDLLFKDSVVYSVGVGTDISFDREILLRHDASVYAFDPTPKSIAWIEDNRPHGKFFFYPYGVGCRTEITSFYLPKEKSHVSGSCLIHDGVSVCNSVNVQLKRICDVMQELGHSHIDMLKLDIEGGEYAVIEDIASSGVRPRQLLVEFHDRMFADGKTRSRRAVEVLRSIGYRIFAASSSFEEISFVLCS